eukprot:5548993-Amphidinium_carterae.1
MAMSTPHTKLRVHSPRLFDAAAGTRGWDMPSAAVSPRFQAAEGIACGRPGAYPTAIVGSQDPQRDQLVQLACSCQQT